MTRLDWIRDPLNAWVICAMTATGMLIIAAIAFPRQVYDEFIWQYFWGPVVADAHAVGTSGCAVRDSGSVDFHSTAAACSEATGIVAHPGYTNISTASYAIILLFALIGIVLIMDRMDLGTEPRFFYGLIPFVFLGGSLRVVEDLNTQIFRDTGDMIVGMPLVGFMISPLIYFLVFFIAALCLLLCRNLEMYGIVDHYEYPMAAAGTVLLVASAALFGYFYVTTDIMQISLIVPIVTLGGATVITAGAWWMTERYWPSVNVGTGFMGAVVIWGHTVDGIANVLSLDWAEEIGLPGTYEPKHVVNRGIIELSSALQPATVSDTIGTAWPFLPVKVFVAIIVVWVFNDEVFEDSPAFAMLLLVAILAVGLGPGTRDFLRAMLGI